MNEFSIEFYRGGKNRLGLISINYQRWSLIIGTITRKYWIWGHEPILYDMCGDQYGLGPIFLLTVLNKEYYYCYMGDS